MKKARLLGILLAAVMLVTVFAGCKPAGDDPSTTTTPAPGTTTTPAPGTTTTAPAGGVDFDGYEFILGNREQGWQVQETPTTLLEEEVRDHYMAIEEEFNCYITFLNGYDGDSAEDLLTAAVSGTKLADFIYVHQMAWIPIMNRDGLRALDTEEMLAAGLEVNNPNNFYQAYTQMTKLNGHVWGLDMTGKYESMSFGHCYAFNKRLVEVAGVTADELFQAVRDYKWDYDMMIDIAKKISDDTDGDGVNDIYGVALDCDGNEIRSNGTAPIVQDETGKWVSNVDDPRIIKAMEFMNRISGDKEVQAPLEGEAVPGRGDRRRMFYDGKAGFAGLYAPNFGRDGDVNGTAYMADPTGLLPIPKGPDVDHYMINMVDTRSFVTLISNQDWEKSAFIMNEIGSRLTSEEGYKEFILEDRLMGDEQSYEMLFDYCMPYATMNMEKCSKTMYEGILRYNMYDKVYKGNITPAGAAEQYSAMIQAELDTLFKQK